MALAGNLGRDQEFGRLRVVIGHHADDVLSQPAQVRRQLDRSQSSATKAVTGSIVTNQYSRLQVRLQIKNGRISHVGFLLTANDSKSVEIDQSAVPILIQETIAAQSAQIQGVSGRPTDHRLRAIAAGRDR